MYNFNVEEQTNNCVEWIRDWFSKNGNENTKAVIGISGGKDSTVVAGLLCKALGKDRVIGVMMPNGDQKDISDSIRVCEFLDIENCTVNIGSAYQTLTKEISEQLQEEITPMYSTNTPARLRMTTLYGVGAIFGNCRIANTCNLSEDLVGYSTYGGDGFNDFAPIAKLTTEEVVEIGDYLNLPKDLTHKTPSDGMCGKSDEDNLGLTYKEINELVRENKKGPNYEKIINRYKANRFKTQQVRLPFYDPKLPLFLEI